jgi:hypothetical protein
MKPTNSAQNNENLENLTKKYSRRDFLRSTITGLGTGLITYSIVNQATKQIGNYITNLISTADEEIARLNTRYDKLYQKLDERIELEKLEFLDQLNQAKEELKGPKFKELYHSTELDITEITNLLEDIDNIKTHYKTDEKLKILKDKTIKKFEQFSEKIKKPKIENFKDLEKEVKDFFGFEIQPNRARNKLISDLSKIYQNNHTIETANNKSAEYINNQLRNIEKHPYLDKELLLFLKYEQDNSHTKYKIKDFIDNYDTYNIDQIQKIKLHKITCLLDNATDLNQTILEKKEYLLELKQNIERRKKLKESLYREHTLQYSQKIETLQSNIEKISTHYKKTLKNLEKDSEKNQTSSVIRKYTSMFKEKLNPIQKYAPPILGGIVGLTTTYLHKKFKAR